MADYLIGDLQGCCAPLQRLLTRIAFSKSRDRVYLAGDLVNRGPDNLGTLRLLREHGGAIFPVLGNHDLYLLALAEGIVTGKALDTVSDVLTATDRSDWLNWLASLPLAQPFQAGPTPGMLVHAGLLPQWRSNDALRLSHEIQAELTHHRVDFLRAMFGNHPNRWHEDLRGEDRWRVAINALTRLRVCMRDGTMEFTTKADPREAAPGFRPWFEWPDRQSRHELIAFGHWSALGAFQQENLLALDSGCVWGRQLTAVRISDREAIQEPCNDCAASGLES
jgi:bis(5'-nucleosyl)-tetraphosphatase (symmetrical)